ncbi:MAG: hypothetical protein K8I27_05355 [Planctomycetes bacterium]|nr:hypothetical protein [Planctomycetota bacterium]
MKRYRIVGYDFDTRANILAMEIKEDWEPRVKDQHEANKAQIRESVELDYGVADAARKLDDFLAIGWRPFSVVAYHNVFFREARDAFVLGSYYPALTGAVSLGERILNHLVLALRDHFKTSDSYKRVYRKESFDNWEVAIAALEEWDVLLPQAATHFRELLTVRNRSVHFDRNLESETRERALEAILLVTKIVQTQFTELFGPPWIIPGTKGATFIARDWETNPFVRKVYLPNCVHVGPYHLLDQNEVGWFVSADKSPESGERTDEEFTAIFNERDQTMRELGLLGSAPRAAIDVEVQT